MAHIYTIGVMSGFAVAVCVFLRLLSLMADLGCKVQLWATEKYGSCIGEAMGFVVGVGWIIIPALILICTIIYSFILHRFESAGI